MQTICSAEYCAPVSQLFEEQEVVAAALISLKFHEYQMVMDCVNVFEVPPFDAVKGRPCLLVMGCQVC